jgi:urea carboxylase
MEGPGGYQFVGRTVQVWNTFRQTADFNDSKPWLLRFFDQIRFYPVTPGELLRMRSDFPHGRVKLRVEESTFRLRDYNQFLRDNTGSIQSWKSTQQAAFDAERRRWDEQGLAHFTSDSVMADQGEQGPGDFPSAWVPVCSEVPGNLWKLLVRKGDLVKEGQRVAVIESMKTEIEVLSPSTGLVTDVFCGEGKLVTPGVPLMCVEPEAVT